MADYFSIDKYTQIIKLEKWLAEEAANTEPPTLADVIKEILSRQAGQGKSSISQSIYNLKDASKTLLFLQRNEIMDMAGLEEKVKSMYRRNQKLRDELKPIERRIETLKEHINQAEIYRKHRGKKTRTESEEILFQSAKRYLDAHLNGHKLNLNKWKAELDTKLSQKEALNQEYHALKDEIAKVWKIKRSIENILREDSQRTQHTKDYERE